MRTYRLVEKKKLKLDERWSHVVQASDENTTAIIVRLPGDQKLFIGVTPDYVKRPTVYINLVKDYTEEEE